MFALTYDTAKTIAIALVAIFVILAVVSAKVAASVTKKVLGVLILGALAVGVWSQRQALQTCADKVRAGGTQTCKFFGSEVPISSPIPGH
ncbi:MAG: hypothetical protein JWL72_3418 [Ilumatobacteraceae bacterium]|nr:hypothetical protein [Ilumatobacteraceae bacterium]MCU1390080.1 hypothetical protein [Ilumatobacteraceae bacterium]